MSIENPDVIANLGSIMLCNELTKIRGAKLLTDLADELFLKYCY